ncbi:unnamed protein product, partial [marine sediment metagenome]
PYSLLNRYLAHAFKLATKGIAYLIGSYSITPLRLELIAKNGFYISKLHYLKVSKWYAMQCFMVLRKRKTNLSDDDYCRISHTRKVYQVSNHIKLQNNQQKL